MGIIQHFVRPRPTEDVPPPPVLGLVLTSGLYPVVERDDTVDMSMGMVPGNSISLVQFFGLESVDLNAVPQTITLVATITYNNYTFWPFEAVDMSAAPGTITLVATINYLNYTFWPFEAVDMTAGPIVANPITLVATINYINNAMGPESIDMAAQPGSITLV